MRRLSLLLTGLFATALCFSQPVVRIVTAGSAMTETVCALGDRPKIVASDRTSLYPAEIQALPSIGYRSSIGAEGIISLRPTLVIMEKDYVEDAVIVQINSAGINTLVIERVYNLEGTKALIREIASTLNRRVEGERLVAAIEGQVAEAAALVKRSKATPRILCIYNRGTSSFDVAGTRTFSAILPYAGAQAAISGVDGYKPLNTEALIASNPDYLLMFESGVRSLGGVEGVFRVPGVMQTTAGKKKQVIVMDGIKLSNFGPRFGEAVKELTLLLHKELQSN